MKDKLEVLEDMPHVELVSGKHVKGQPYPEHDFSYVQKHGIFNEQGVIACSNNDVKKQIEAAYAKNPEATETLYFYYQEHKLNS